MAQKFLITGGAGFIGSNYVSRLVGRGERVAVFDNLSRRGAEVNLRWLRETYGENAFDFIQGDVRNFDQIKSVAADADVIVHLAAQVAVTSSVTCPREDFEINALGTFNVLEAARLAGRKPLVIYSSTNKVYGGMEDVAVVEEPTRYRYADLPAGVSEDRPLDFHSPYGCSKGAGDQYIRDYSRIYDLPTVVFRQSCIYGPRQFGLEDQGWVAWFIIAALTERPITIYGDGKQVRDLLFVEDLLNAYDRALERRDRSAGRVYNVGGGPVNTISVWQEFRTFLNGTVQVAWNDWRPGDQKIFVSDTRRAERELDWTPATNVETGIGRLKDWTAKNKNLFV